MRRKISYKIIPILIFVIVTACSGFQLPSSIENTATSVVIVLPTLTQSIEIPILSPTLIFPKKSITPPPSPPFTTPIPTLLPNEKQKRIFELLGSNGHCELPCWWGIVPGETKWNDAVRFLTPFVDGIRVGQETKIDKDGQSLPYIPATAYITIDGYTEVMVINFGVTDGIVTWMHINEVATGIRFSIDQVLQVLGVPDEVYIYIEPETPDGKPWFGLDLFYTAQKAIIIYDGVGEYDGKYIQICPQSIDPRIDIISENLALNEMVWMFYDSSIPPLPSITDVTQMSILDFTRVMSDKGGCLLVQDED